MERIIGSQFQPLDCHQAMCTSMIVSITLVLIMALNKFVPFFMLLTMQCISISWMLINRLIIQTVACMPLIYAVMKMCILGNMTQY